MSKKSVAPAPAAPEASQRSNVIDLGERLRCKRTHAEREPRTVDDREIAALLARARAHIAEAEALRDELRARHATTEAAR
jgi:hypothetical protein